MKKVLITGIHGQDGSYLSELLLSKGYQIFGTVRDLSRAKNTLDQLNIEYSKLYTWDMVNYGEIERIIRSCEPDEIYNLAAFSTGSGMYDDPLSMADVNGFAVAKILEAIRQVNKSIRFCQASSSEMYGEPLTTPQNEDTPFKPRSPYGAAKLYAHTIIDVYRKVYGIHCTSAILFNHESPRRRECFVTRKITSTAVKIKLNLENELFLGNLDARRDWGFAGDYMSALWHITNLSKSSDFVISSGVTHSVKEFCEIAFNCLDLDYRKYVKIDQRFYRQLDPNQLIGDSTKLLNETNWRPTLSFEELVKSMVQNDMKIHKL